MPNEIVHIDFVGPDRGRSSEWYGSLFDWTITPIEEAQYTLFNTTPTSGGGFMDDGSGRASIIPYVAVTDIQAALDKALAAGASVVMPVTKNEMVTFAIFEDPFGHRVGLVLDERSEGGQP